LAQELLPEAEPSAYNQAIMDFGAIQCTPQSPRCMICPLMETCDALRTGRVAQLPVKQKTLKVKERHLSYIYIRCGRQVAIHRRGAGDIWQGLWEPYLETDCHKLQLKGQYTILQRGVKHVLTHRVLLADFALLQSEEQPPLPPDYIWVDEALLGDYAVPRLVEHLYRQVRLYDEKNA
jgi:A/G-specific adenine glycosylase